MRVYVFSYVILCENADVYSPNSQAVHLKVNVSFKMFFSFNLFFPSHPKNVSMFAEHIQNLKYLYLYLYRDILLSTSVI